MAGQDVAQRDMKHNQIKRAQGLTHRARQRKAGHTAHLKTLLCYVPLRPVWIAPAAQRRL